jgi:hypothetical protein
VVWVWLKIAQAVGKLSTLLFVLHRSYDVHKLISLRKLFRSVGGEWLLQVKNFKDCLFTSRVEQSHVTIIKLKKRL